MTINFLTPELIELLGAGFWHLAIVFLRIGSMTAILPGFGEDFVPIRIKLAIGLVLTIAVAPTVPTISTPANILEYASYCGTEALIGVSMGLGIKFFVHALQTAGTIAAQTTSLSQVFGGEGVDPIPALGALLWISGLTIIFILDLHLRIIEMMTYTYKVFPVGFRIDASTLSQWGIYRVSQSFAMAFTLASPFLVTAIIYNLTLGFISRAMPQLMIFMIGAPMVAFAGIAIMLVASPIILDVWSRALIVFINNPGAGIR